MHPRPQTDGTRIGMPLAPETLAAVVLLSAVFFNAILAAANAHVMSLSRLHVSLVEGSITALAVAIVALNFRSSMRPWALLLALILLLDIALAVGNQSFSPKLIRDVINIPIFIALGMVFARGNMVRLFVWIQAAVLFGALVEYFDVDLYAKAFDIVGYYVNTRDLTAHSFWNTDSTLFVSATRPDDRFLFGFLGDHRVSSVFLEPVSLGNYCVVATIFVLAFWRELSWRAAAFLVVSTAVILIGSDGRLAAVTCVLLVLGSFVFPALPRYSNALFLPGILLVAAVLVQGLALRHTGDDFTGRLAGSMDFLRGLDLAAWLGLDVAQAANASDSGISYFIVTQSVFGVALIWLFICFVPAFRDAVSMSLIYGICLYVPLILLVSYSLFSIKTAGLMWFMYGHVLARAAVRGEAPGAVARRLPADRATAFAWGAGAGPAGSR